MAPRRIDRILSYSLVLSMFVNLLAIPAAPRQALAEDNHAPPDRRLPVSDLTQATALSQPVSISRVQSGYQAGSSTLITLTITNNLPPVRLPDIPVDATMTETVHRVASFVIS